jgi:hypothetical protein
MYLIEHIQVPMIIEVVNKHWLDYLQGMGSLAIGLSTFIFALIINKRISFKKNFKEKQFDTVTDLIIILQDIEIVFEIENRDLEMSTGTCVPFFNINISKERFKDIRKIKMFITYNFYENLPFIKFSRHPFIPDKIAKAIDKFWISFPYAANTNEDNKIMMIDFHRISGDNVKNKKLIFSQYDEICRDFDSFFQICCELNNEIRVWLNKYGVKELNFR